MEATTDTKRTVTLFDKANFQLQNTIFQHDHIVMHGYIVSPLMNKSLHAVLVKICINGDDPLLLLPLLSAPPIPHCAHIHCLVFVNVQQALMNVIGCKFLHMEEFSCTSLLHTHFLIRCRSVRLLLCSHLLHCNNM